MSYLHCHTKGCNWSQDDFWDFSFSRNGGYFRFRPFKFWWKYNPISLFLSQTFGYKGNIIPRRIIFDTNCKIYYGFKRIDPYSWWLIWYDFKKMIRKFKKQKWWTYKAWENDKDAVCPICKQRNFDID